MVLFDLFSKRQKRARGEFPDVYQYDTLPKPLRVQIVHIVNDALGEDSNTYSSKSEAVFLEIHDILAREYGVFSLGDDHSARSRLLNFFLRETSIERALDCVELLFRAINFYGGRNEYISYTQPRVTPKDAAAELNARFQEHGVGYQFEERLIVRTDSQFLHAEAVKPALSVLSGAGFKGAEKEFLGAHEHYRHGRFEEAITEALKAFESTMKSICGRRKWAFRETDTAKALLEVCFREGLIPPSLQSEFTALRSVLESGVPTIRNKQAGHGSGAEARNVPKHLAGYALHLTAASILFLAEADAALK